jgi:hypothetical protein
MSYYTMAFMGMTPFGSLFGGAIAARFGAPRALTVSGLVCIACAGIYFAYLPTIRRALRPIYIELGILPQMTEAISAASTLASDSTPQ